MHRLHVPLVIAFAIATVLVCGCNSLDNAPISDIEKLQGTWVGQELGREGKVTIVLSGNTIEFQGAHPQERYKGTMTLYEDRSPKQADFTITECSFPAYIGKISKTIYTLEGSTFTFAGSEPGTETRPSSFDASGVNRVFQLTLQSSETEQ